MKKIKLHATRGSNGLFRLGVSKGALEGLRKGLGWESNVAVIMIGQQHANSG